MRQDKDRVAKWLLTHHGDALLRLGGISGFTRWKPIQAETVAPRRLPDGLLEVQFPGQEKPTLVLVEVETYPGSDVDEQVHDDLMLVFLDRRLVPEVISLVLRPKGNLSVTGVAERASVSGRTRLSGTWPVVRLWEQDAETLFAAGNVGLVPWVPLSRSDQPPEVLLTRCRDVIDKVPDRVKRAGLLAVTEILAGLAFPDRRFLDIFGGPEIMIESPVLDEVKEILRKRYEAQYKTEGRAEGQAEASRQMAVEFLADRFGAVPDDVQTKLAAITDVPRLKSLVRLAATCSDLATFVAAASG